MIQRLNGKKKPRIEEISCGQKAVGLGKSSSLNLWITGIQEYTVKRNIRIAGWVKILGS